MKAAGGLIVWEIGVNIGTEIGGEIRANVKKASFPDMTLAEHTSLSDSTSAKWYNRLSFTGHFGTAMQRIFGEPKS